jgi:ankyrin repeat protein
MESVKAWKPYDFGLETLPMDDQIDVNKIKYVNWQNKLGQTPLKIAIHDRAVREGHSTQIVDFLIENGADVNAVDRNGRTPLFMCYRQKYSGIIEVLIANGADLNAVDNDTETPLFKCVLCLPVTEQFIHHGAHVNIINRYGETPLHAALKNHLSVQFLISNGADIEAADNWGETPINKAVQSGNFESFEKLVHAGANLSTVDNDGETLLHLAVRSELITQFLIGHGADVNAVDNHGQTPFIVAANCRTLPSAMLLWQADANLYIKNYDGESAFDICTRTWPPDNPVREVFTAENYLRRNEAFAMSQHGRLGEVSWASILSPETLPMILSDTS